MREVIGVELVRREFLPATAAVKRKVKTYRKQLRLLTNAQHRQSVCYSLYVRTCLRSVCNFNAGVHQQMVMMFGTHPLTVEGFPRALLQMRAMCR